jgi:glycosyltransferase involved in cell wall biosynthesis
MGLHLYFGGIALFWLGVLARVRRNRAAPRWKLGPDDPVDMTLPRLTVVIPARDEAANIGACVTAVRASDHPSVEVVVFDDGSTDGTGELAAAAGARVLRGGGGELPEGWKGKPWALQRATRELDAEWILFLDADVRVHPACLSRVHAMAVRDSIDFLSGFGRLEMDSFWEKVIQPSVGGLILAGNDLDRVNDPERRKDVIANGQLILVRRSAYEAVGGHEAVREDILDDVGLARAFAREGFALRILFLRELFSCRMYTSFQELWLGWTKNLYAGMGYRLDRVVFLAGFILYEFLTMWVALAWGLVTGDAAVLGWGAGLVLLSQGARLWLDHIFGQDKRFGILQPLGALLLVGLIVDSARRSRSGAVAWKGRTYAARADQAARFAREDSPPRAS